MTKFANFLICFFPLYPFEQILSNRIEISLNEGQKKEKEV